MAANNPRKILVAGWTNDLDSRPQCCQARQVSRALLIRTLLFSASGQLNPPLCKTFIYSSSFSHASRNRDVKLSRNFLAYAEGKIWWLEGKRKKILDFLRIVYLWELFPSSYSALHPSHKSFSLISALLHPPLIQASLYPLCAPLHIPYPSPNSDFLISPPPIQTSLSPPPVQTSFDPLPHSDFLIFSP